MLSALSFGADLADYKIDLEGPLHPTEWNPTRVNIYVAEEKINYDKSPFGYLVQRQPVLSITNETEITNLVSALREHDNKERVTNSLKRKGRTYHFLLFQDPDHTAMHFRVLEFTDVQTEWYEVWPRSDIGFCYFNKSIGPWLQLHVKATTTNSPTVSN